MKANKRASERFGLAGIVASIAVFLSLGSSASADNADCERLRRAIADASRSGQSAQFQAAAERQRGEIDRTAAYAHELGCDNKKFLFFGSEPPPQCGEIRGQIGRMQASLSDLEAHSGGGREDLIARYNAECGAAAAPNRETSLFASRNHSTKAETEGHGA